MNLGPPVPKTGALGRTELHPEETAANLVESLGVEPRCRVATTIGLANRAHRPLAQLSVLILRKSGTPGRARTCDLDVRSVVLFQLSYGRKNCWSHRHGFEPATCRLQGGCSSLLSYGGEKTAFGHAGQIRTGEQLLCRQRPWASWVPRGRAARKCSDSKLIQRFVLVARDGFEPSARALSRRRSPTSRLASRSDYAGAKQCFAKPPLHPLSYLAIDLVRGDGIEPATFRL